MALSEFDKEIINALRKIPRGKITTYRLIAEFIERPKAARAVGNACHKNPFAPRVPCHRVVRSDAGLGGYGGGIKKKIALLQKEGVCVKNEKIMNFKEKLFKIK